MMSKKPNENSDILQTAVLYVVGVSFLYFFSHQHRQMLEPLYVHSKNPINFLFIFQQVHV